MNFKNLFRIAALFGMPCFLVQAQTIEQDTLSHLNKINQQYNNERDFKTNYFYNPATMSDYSSSSFTSVQIGYTADDNKAYRQIVGQKHNSYGLTTNSYQKISENMSIWGKASYSSNQTKGMQWNENLDVDRIFPYVVSDSVRADLDIEKYHFLGGFSQKINRFTIGLEGEYSAQMGSRSRDPRNKTITSDLLLKFGINYHIHKALEVGAYIQGEKYTQNNHIRFASLLGYPILYQMTSFGNYNYMFSGGSSDTKTLFEQFGYEYGGYISNRDAKDFYVLFRQGNSDLVKSTDGIYSSQYDIADVQDKFTIIEGGKFFGNDRQRYGLKLQYGFKQRLGSEYGYSNNTNVLEQIYKQVSYRRQVYNYRADIIYQLTASHVSLGFMPFINYEEYDERRLRPLNGQKWKSLTLGIAADFKAELSKQNSITIQPYFSHKTVNNKDYLFDTTGNEAIRDWVLNDYNYLSSDVTTLGATFRYDIKMNKVPGLFVSFNWENNQILKQNNNYTSLQLGVIF